MPAVALGSRLVLRATCSRLLAPTTSAVTGSRNAYWNKDWKPEARPPSTPEEHAAAAAKYGMLPQDYRPILEPGISTDYPDLPILSGEARDPYHNWDNPELKRDFGEPMHEDFDLYAEDRYDANRRLRFSEWTMMGVFLAVMGTYTLVFIYFDDKKMFRPVMPKQFPGTGPHYSFELED